jgi:hypothetical protein
MTVIRLLLTSAAVVISGLVVGCTTPPAATTSARAADRPVTKLGTIEVTARLLDVPAGAIFKRQLYDYATVLKYEVIQVHRGSVPNRIIYVAHYNPFKPRAEAADRRVKTIGGDLVTFAPGQVHRMALEPSAEEHYMGGVVNLYIDDAAGDPY